MSAGHAKLAPSSAGRWVYCPGSVAMEGAFPDEGDAGAEGEASHWVASRCLSTGEVHNAGEVAPNGVVLDMSMVGGAYEYAKAVANGCPEWGRVALHVEEPVAIPAVHSECWGTPDLWWFTPMGQSCPELHVWDYKYGWGLVEVVNNWQLTCYAVGILSALTRAGVNAPDVLVCFHIAQPRPYHKLGSVRHWRVSAKQLLAGPVQQLQAAAHEALSPDARCATGSHCRYCRARHACTPFRSAAYAALEYIERAKPHELSAEALGVEMEILERAEQAILHLKTAVEAQAIGLINKGVTVPGWTLERGSGRSTWTVPDEVLFAMGDLHRVNLRNTKPLTPYQAKNAGFPADVVRAFSTAPLGDPKLVPMKRSLTAQVFGPAAAARNDNQ